MRLATLSHVNSVTLTLITVNSEPLTLINCILIYITGYEHMQFSLSELGFPLSKNMSIFLIRQLLIGQTAPYNKIPDWLFRNANGGRTVEPKFLDSFKNMKAASRQQISHISNPLITDCFIAFTLLLIQQGARGLLLEC